MRGLVGRDDLCKVFSLLALVKSGMRWFGAEAESSGRVCKIDRMVIGEGPERQLGDPMCVNA